MIVLERIREGDWNAVERMRETLESLVIETGGLSLRFRAGTIDLTFTASDTSAANSVDHGLGREPIAVFYGNGDTNIANVATTARDATSITAQARYVSTVTGTASISWVAIG